MMNRDQELKSLAWLIHLVKEDWCFRVDIANPPHSYSDELKGQLRRLNKLGMVETKTPVGASRKVKRPGLGTSTLADQLQYRLTAAGKKWKEENPL